MRNGLEQFDELGVAVVGHPALPAEVVVVGGDEARHGHATLRVVLEQVGDLAAYLVQLLGQHGTVAHPASVWK